ncbi:MAG: hypothetical protein J6D26_00620 [Clostridia bacterium]|nr:hypothetical protein [Clostridia bacterium]
MINVREFVKENITTESVQAAIDYASEHKKTLFFPRGVYSVTSLALRSDSSVYLDKDALISASLSSTDWEKSPMKPVFYCENAKNVCIRGTGTITANGYAFTDESGYRKKTASRPEAVILFRNVCNVMVENITLKETVGWTFHLDNCDNVLLDGIQIRNPTYVTRKNSDGIDINGCRNVTVMNCDIETGDDAICLKNIDYTTCQSGYTNTSLGRRDMYNINVYNCTCASTCNSTKIGTETVGNIYDVSFEKIRVRKHPLITGHGAGNPPFESYRALSAISVQSNDGSVVKNIRFKDYYIETVDTPIFILYQQRGTKVPATDRGEISNITIENIYVDRSYRTSQILSSHTGKISNVKISGMYIRTYEEKASEYDFNLPTGAEYPDVYNFGKFPSYGLFSRNAANVDIRDDVLFYDETNSGRPDIDIG